MASVRSPSTPPMQARHRPGFLVARENVRGLGRMIAERVAIIAVVVVAVSGLIFWLADLSPFDPLAHYLGADYGTISPAQRAEIARAIGADGTWWQQWLRWSGDVWHGDLGYSRVYHRPVAQVMTERLPWTLLLSGAGLAVMTLLALVLGSLAGRRPGGPVDRFVVGFGVFVAATPSYVYSLGVILVFAITLRVIPAGGAGPAGQAPSLINSGSWLIAPAIVLAVSQISWPLLAVRQATVEATTSPAADAARVRGLPDSVVAWRHVAPMSLLPLITLVGGRLGELVVGAVIVEAVFMWPGLAQATVESAVAMDFPLLAIITVATTIVVMAGSLIADCLYLLIDPRVNDV